MGTENRKFTRRNIDLVVQIEMIDGTIIRGVVLDLSQWSAPQSGQSRQFARAIHVKTRGQAPSVVSNCVALL